MSSRFRKEGGKWVLDVRGFTCPYPVIYTRKALSSIKGGELLEVIIDNPPSCETVPNAAKEGGHEVLEVSETGRGVWKIIIRKSAKG